MKKKCSHVWNTIKNHKKKTLLILILIIGGAWYYHSSTATVASTYVTRKVSLGTIRSAVSGTGQVQSFQEVSVSPKVSADVISINVKNGDTVHAGDLIATLDNTNALFSLQNAKISLAKLESSNPVSLSGSQNSVSSSQDNLNQSYSTAFNSLVSTYSDMGSILTSLNDMFYTNGVSPYFYDGTSVSQTYGPAALQYKTAAGVELDKAAQGYAAFRQVYSTISQNSTDTLVDALNKENKVAVNLLQAVKDTAVTVNYIISLTPKSSRTTAMNTDSANLSSWISTVNKDTSDVSSNVVSIQSNTRSLNQSTASLQSVQSGSNPLDIQSAQVSLAQAQYNYSQYFIRAPFDGIVGNVTLHKGDSAGPSSIIATIVTKDYISKISLNEVDSAKVAVGQPVAITFNALQDLKVNGTVSDVDTVGSVSQGVVSYTVTISFDTDDSRVKAGMSINADITTAEKDNVIVVPSSALKTVGNRTLVQIPAGPITYPTSATTANGSGSSSTARTNNRMGTATAVTTIPVEIGLSDDTNTEITSGLNEGDIIVIRTITNTSSSASSQASILSSLSGGRGGFGGGGATAQPTISTATARPAGN